VILAKQKTVARTNPEIVVKKAFAAFSRHDIDAYVAMLEKKPDPYDPMAKLYEEIIQHLRKAQPLPLRSEIESRFSKKLVDEAIRLRIIGHVSEEKVKPRSESDIQEDMDDFYKLHPSSAEHLNPYKSDPE
jgi:hypothetical protein